LATDAEVDTTTTVTGSPSATPRVTVWLDLNADVDALLYPYDVPTIFGVETSTCRRGSSIGRPHVAAPLRGA
jgi:hypothetical protein